MAKGGSRGKSSASSSTRKKQATKAAKKQAYERDEHGNLVNPELAEALEKQKQPGPQRGQKKDKTKGKDGKKGKVEKKKQYVPPPKPPQPLPDPLDSMGLASLLPADLVVLLRKASKKDVITRCRALEGILAWTEDALGKTSPATSESNETSDLDKDQKQEALVVMLPCWVHLFPRLALSPTRRLRLLTMQIQTLLLQKSSDSAGQSVTSTRSELLESPQYVEPMLAPWAILCFDTDRTIERLGRAAWSDTCSWKTPDSNGSEGNVSQLYLLDHLDTLLAHLRTILLSPSPSFALSMTSAHAPMDQAMSQSNSGTATPIATLERDAKNRDDSNVEEDTSALDKRLVAGALSVLTTIVSEHPTPKPAESLQDLLLSRLLWSSLSPSDLMQSVKQRKNASTSTSFGFESPHVRVRAWTLLRAVNSYLPTLLNEVLDVAGVVAMTSAWQERDLGVQRSMLDAILPLLKANPHLWLAGESTARSAQNEASLDEDSSDEDDEEDDQDDDDDEDEDSTEEEIPATTAQRGSEIAQPKIVPRSYATFLQWLQSVCGGGPVLGYPAVVVFISTLPAEILAHDDYAAASDLLDQMFSALYSRALDNDPAACRAFLSSFSEVIAFLAIRMYRSGNSTQTHKDAQRLAHTHFTSLWRNLVLNHSSISTVVSGDDDAADEERILSQRIKNMSSSRITLELSNQLRRMASVASDLDLVTPILISLEEDLAGIAQSLATPSNVDLLASNRAKIQSSLERAASLLAGVLHPSSLVNQQQSDALMRKAVNGLVNRTLTLTASLVADIAEDSSQETALKKLKADILSELMSLLLPTLVSAHDHDIDSDLRQVDKVASVSIPLLTAARSISASSAASFLSSYLPLCSSADSRAAIWTETLSSVADLIDIADQVDVISGLLRAIEIMRSTKQGGVVRPVELPVPDASAGVEDLLMTMTASLCNVDHPDSRIRPQLRDVIAGILASPKPFVEESVRDAMLAMVTSTIEQLRNLLLTSFRADRIVDQHKIRAARVIPDLLDCLEKWLTAQPKEQSAIALLESNRSVVAGISDLALLAPSSHKDIAQKASRIWALLTERSSAATYETVLQEALTSLQSHLVDIHVPVGVIVPAAQRICAQLSGSSALVILPKHAELETLLDNAARNYSHPALLTFDPLIAQQQEGSTNTPLDAEGLGVFARICLCITLTFEQDRKAARQNVALLPLLILFALLIEDDLLFDGASKHNLSTSLAHTSHRSWLQRSIAVSTALISSLSETVTENWHNDMVMLLQRSQVADQTRDALGHALTLVWQAGSKEPESDYLARVFRRLLSAAFNFGTIGEAGADRWLKLADSVQDKRPLLAQAVVLAAKEAAGSSPIYERLRSASAAKLAGLGPTTSPTKVLQALRMLVAVAPPQDSDLSLIPQQRAIFLLKDLQKWYSSDESEEEPDEEVNYRLAELFVHLIPIVQDVQGSHFDFMFDLIETNLEFSSLQEATSLPQLYASLRLLETLREYAARNANLREYWKERKLASLQLVRDLFLSLATPNHPRDQPFTDSAPRQACADLIVDLIREVPSTSFDMDKTCAPLCKLLIESPSHDVQVISYRLLSISIRDHVKELVVETAVNKDAISTEEFQARMKLPEALIANVSDSLGAQLELLVEEEAARKTALGYFMSWIAIFDHFENASLAVKSAYVADLEKRGLLPVSLLPSVFALVGLADQDRRLFDPSRFAVDEVFLDQIDVASSLTVLQVIAAHVYLRALIHVPTMVRSWWVDIKDRQLSMQIANFTIRHCSPVIASRELSHLREPEALSRLQDEALTIKILSTNEVIATYVVDEHPMEIGVKIPADFPLHGVEIRDIQRVGITEAKWRSWLLAVQQLITGQNGLIFDALSLFKRNAEVQFQGLEECAICYSIISPMDRSLPSKPCKTCKNKFHSGCLYKWISTSGSSTCPLCRSIL